MKSLLFALAVGLVCSGSALATPVVRPLIDFDFDGMSDLWTSRSPGVAGHPQADPDGDGATNLQEYLAGTDPLLANSRFSHRISLPSPETVELRWRFHFSKAYRVEASSDLGTWDAVVATIDVNYHTEEAWTLLPFAAGAGAGAGGQSVAVTVGASPASSGGISIEGALDSTRAGMEGETPGTEGELEAPGRVSWVLVSGASHQEAEIEWQSASGRYRATSSIDARILPVFVDFQDDRRHWWVFALAVVNFEPLAAVVVPAEAGFTITAAGSDGADLAEFRSFLEGFHRHYNQDRFRLFTAWAERSAVRLQGEMMAQALETLGLAAPDGAGGSAAPSARFWRVLAAEQDRDGDRLTDYEEFLAGTPGLNSDGDEDGMADGWELYFGWQHGWGALHGFDPRSYNQAAASADPDGDGLSHAAESLHWTHPFNPDTDVDGMTDGWEVRYGFSPTRDDSAQLDPDLDGFPNLMEFQMGTDPRDFYNAVEPVLRFLPRQPSPRGLSQVVAVEIRSPSGFLLAHAPMRFRVAHGPGRFGLDEEISQPTAEVEVRTDAQGVARIFFRQP